MLNETRGQCDVRRGRDGVNSRYSFTLLWLTLRVPKLAREGKQGRKVSVRGYILCVHLKHALPRLHQANLTHPLIQVMQL